MIISYEEFKQLLDCKIKDGNELFLEILNTIADSPSRYAGLFRLSNAKTKLLQNLTQSREIKLGDFLEDLVTEYLDRVGYNNLDKDLGANVDGDRLSVDQIFKDTEQLYIVEQKIRDDHDSTKKRGQFDNFIKKIDHVCSQHPGKKLVATMWFIDDSLKKNKRYYLNRIEAESQRYQNVTMHLCYGGEIFEQVLNKSDIWTEITSHLTRMRLENASDLIEIPDLDTDEGVFESMKELEKGKLRKLTCSRPEYVLMRTEIFPTCHNFNKLKVHFQNTGDTRSEVIDL